MKTLSCITRRFGLLLAAPVVITILAVIVACNSGSSNQTTAAPPQNEKARQKEAKTSLVTFNKDGTLIRPIGYRKWTYVGTPVTPNDMNDGNAPFPEFHAVYVNPAAFNHYEKTGKFPDGTVLVKELTSVGSNDASSGKGYFMGEFIGLEVSIKDKTRFEDEPGNWAYFSFGHKYPLKDKAIAQPAASCNACHEGVADEDWVFTQYYPVLRAAKPAVSE
jgi:hypothetical protein